MARGGGLGFVPFAAAVIVAAAALRCEGKVVKVEGSAGAGEEPTCWR